MSELPRTDHAREETPQAEQETQRQEIEKLKEQVEKLKAAVHLPELDNHHNALKCPYCNPKQLDPEALEAEVTTLRQQLEDMRNYDALQNFRWRGVCGHEWILRDSPKTLCPTCALIEDAKTYLARAVAAESALQQRTEALKKLVNKLESVHADPRYMAVWESYMIHSGRYTGPMYTAELAATEAILRGEESPVTTVEVRRDALKTIVEEMKRYADTAVASLPPTPLDQIDGGPSAAKLYTWANTLSALLDEVGAGS